MVQARWIQTNKKILSSLITTILIISILAFPAPYVSASRDDDIIFKISLDSGPIGVSVTVSGNTTNNVNSTYPVYVYWSTDEPKATSIEYGYGFGDPKDLGWKLLATQDESIKGKLTQYTVDVTIPHVSANGTVIYLIAWQDVNNNTKVDDGEWDYEDFTVVQGIYPSTASVGSTVTVGGWATPGGLVEVYWDNTKAENKLGETWAEGDGSFSATVTVPEAPYESATHYIIVYDASAKQNVFSTPFTIKPKITLSPSTALPKDTITVSGTGFAASKKITLTMYNSSWTTTLTTDPSTVTTDANGSFSCTFKVPSGLVYMKYTVKATDGVSPGATATLTVGATITLSPAEGPTGTVVTINGRGWDAVSAGTKVTVLIQDGDGVNETCPVVAAIKVAADGTFKGEFIVPTVSVGTYTINATAGGVSGTLSFKVTGTTKITLSPTSGAPESSVTIEGVNFTAIADTKVTIDFGPIKAHATTTTNSTGGFKTVVTVPPLTPQTTPYDVVAKDAKGLNAAATFRVALTTLAVSPSSGPTGTKVLVVGGGLTPSKKFSVTIGGKLMINGTGTLDSDGNIPDNFYVYVPTIDAGDYTITVMDEKGVTASASFTVTKTTEIVLSPSSAPQNYTVTIKLNNFIAAVNKTITLKIYNVTAEGEIYWEDYIDYATYKLTPSSGFYNDTSGYPLTNSTGCFEGKFTVPTSLALGDYYINATDTSGLTDLISFSIVEPEVIVYTGATEYMPGDTITFFAKCTFDYADQVVNIYTPKDFKIVVSNFDIVTKLGNYYTGTVSWTLPTDATLGTWVWNATIGGKTVSGTFTVVEKPTMAGLSVEVSRLKEDVASLSKKVEDLRTTVSTQRVDIDKLSKAVSDLTTAVSSLTSDVSALSDALSTLRGDVQNVASAVSEAQSAAEGASEAASAAQSAAAGISTAVYGAVILSLIAAVAAIMSIIILQRKIAG